MYATMTIFLQFYGIPMRAFFWAHNIEVGLLEHEGQFLLKTKSSLEKVFGLLRWTLGYF